MTQEPKFVTGERVGIIVLGGPADGYLLPFDGQITTVTKVEEYLGEFYYFTDIGCDDGLPWKEPCLRKLPPDTPAQFDESIWAPKKEVV